MRSTLADARSAINTSPLIETKAILIDLVGYRAAKHKDEKKKTRDIKFHTTVS